MFWASLCGLCAAACVIFATGAAAGTRGAQNLRLQKLRRAARHLTGVIGASYVGELLLSWGPFGLAVDELCAFAAGRGRELGRRDASAVLLVCSLGVSACGAVAMGSPLGGFAAVAAVGVLLAMRRSARDRACKAEVVREMPLVFRTLSTALASGQTLLQALEYVGLHEAGPAAQAFARASLRLRCGMSAEEALGSLQEELDAPGIGLMTCALAISQRTGSPLRDLFQRSAALVEQQGDLERMLSVRTAQVRLSVRVVCGLPPLMVCLLAAISPDYRLGISGGAGVACLVCAFLLDALALLIIRKIMKGVLV